MHPHTVSFLRHLPREPVEAWPLHRGGLSEDSASADSADSQPLGSSEVVLVVSALVEGLCSWDCQLQRPLGWWLAVPVGNQNVASWEKDAGPGWCTQAMTPAGPPVPATKAGLAARRVVCKRLQGNSRHSAHFGVLEEDLAKLTEAAPPESPNRPAGLRVAQRLPSDPQVRGV